MFKVLSVMLALDIVYLEASVKTSLSILTILLDFWSSNDYSPTLALNFHNSLLSCRTAPLNAYHLLTGLIKVKIPDMKVVNIVAATNAYVENVPIING